MFVLALILGCTGPDPVDSDSGLAHDDGAEDGGADAGGDGGTTGDGGGGGVPDYQECDDVTSELAPSDVSGLGFSAADVLAVVAGPTTAVGTWSDGGPTITVSLAVAAAGSPVFHDRSPAADTGGSDSGMGGGGADGNCYDWLDVPVTIAFSTDDGKFAEAVSANVTAIELSSMWASGELDWSALSGTYTFTEIDPAKWDDVALSLSAGWAGGATMGQVDMSASREIADSGGGATGEGIVGPVLRW